MLELHANTHAYYHSATILILIRPQQVPNSSNEDRSALLQVLFGSWNKSPLPCLLQHKEWETGKIIPGLFQTRLELQTFTRALLLPALCSISTTFLNPVIAEQSTAQLLLSVITITRARRSYMGSTNHS